MNNISVHQLRKSTGLAGHGSPLPASAGELLKDWAAKISLLWVLTESSEPLEDGKCGF